ncbi:hypothetical protein CYMTET_36096, partial [Cymbomonas tetramitiformis]
GWKGGVASLAPESKAVTHGALVELSQKEKVLLDTYEGGYREEVVNVLVAGQSRPAVVYIAGQYALLSILLLIDYIAA